MFMFLV